MLIDGDQPDNLPAPDQTPESDNPFLPLVQAWLSKIEKALQHKEAKFNKIAREAVLFYAGGTALSEHMYGPGVENNGRRGFVVGADEMPAPKFRYAMNKVAEVVQLFGPTLYHRNPARLVTPRTFKPLPAEVFAALMAPNGLPPAGPPEPQLSILPPPHAAPGPGLPAQGPQQPGMPPAPPDPMQALMMAAQQAAQQMAQQDSIGNALENTRAELMSEYLNYSVQETNHKLHSRRVVNEALIKGMGCWWTEVTETPGMDLRMVGSFFDSVDNLVLDPDAEELENCKWIARRCIHPKWEVEEEYGLEPGALKSASGLTSADSDATMDVDRTGAGKTDGKTADLVRYWKIYSKLGMGDRLAGTPPELQDQFDEFGDHCYLVICPGISYPLNLPPSVTTPPSADEVAAYQADAQNYELASAQAAAMPAGFAPPGMAPPAGEPPVDPQQEFKDGLFEAAQWPIPFWAANAWPMTPLYWHEVPNCAWPMSHVAPGLAELKFLNWCMSFLMEKVRSSCRTVIATLESLEDDVKNAIIYGPDNSVIGLKEIHGAKNINELVSFLKSPDFHKDIYEVLDRVAQDFDKRVGLSEILYGMQAVASRSATDVNVRQNNASIRLDDMAARVEDAETELARKEALAARWVLDAQDVAPVLGQQRAMLWSKLIQSADIPTVVRELDYRIEAGSIKKPNFAKLSDDANTMAQTFGPFFQQLAMTGQVGPFNALVTAVCKAIQIDAGPFLIQPPPPPPPPMGPPGPQGPPGAHPPAPAPHPQPPPPAAPPARRAA